MSSSFTLSVSIADEFDLIIWKCHRGTPIADRARVEELLEGLRATNEIKYTTRNTHYRKCILCKEEEHWDWSKKVNAGDLVPIEGKADIMKL